MRPAGPDVRHRAPSAVAFGGSAVVVAVAASAGALVAHALGRDPVAGALAGIALVAVAFLLATAPLSATFSAALAASVLSGNSGAIGLPIGLDRLLLAFGCARLVLAGWPRRHPGYGAAHWLILLAAVWAVLSAAWSHGQQDHQSLFELLDRFGLVPFLLFFIAPVVFATARDRRILLGTLTAVGVYLGLTAIFEMAGPSALVFPRYILDPSVGVGFGRARGPFAEAGSNGLALHACAVSAILLAIRVPRRGLRILLLGIVVLCAIGVLLTLTRQVWIGALLSTVVVLFAGARARRLAVPVLAAAVVAVGLAYVAVPGLHAKVAQRATDQRPVWDRLNLNAAAIRMVDHRPLLGWGWNGFRTHGQDWIRQSPTYPQTAPETGVHNVVLANLAELGVIGTAVWLAALIAGVGVAVLRRPPPELHDWRLATGALVIAWVVVVNLSPMNTAFPNALLWLWAGILWRPRGIGRDDGRPPSERGSHEPPPPRDPPPTAEAERAVREPVLAGSGR